VMLDVGPNVIRAYAGDQAGNEIFDSVVIFRRDLDTSAPQVIRSDASTQDRVVPMSTVEATLSWKVSDAALSQVRIGDSVVQGSGGVYARTFALAPGENLFRLTATDSSGNVTVDSVVINRTDALTPTRVQAESTLPASTPEDSTFALFRFVFASDERIYG